MPGRPSIAPSSNSLAPLAAVLTAMLSIMIGASIAKTLFPIVGPVGTAALRLAMAAVILCLAFRVWRLRLGWQKLMAAVPYGLSLGGMNLLFYMAINRIPLGVALAIEFIGPLSLALWSSRRRADLAWVALVVLGLVLLIPAKASPHPIDPIGACLALAAGLFWAGYIVTGKRAGERIGAQTPALGMLVGAAVVLPFGIAQAGSALLAPHVLAVAVAVGLLSSAIPYSLEMFALRRLPVRTFSILTSGEPAVGAVVAMLLLHEVLPLGRWLGIAAIMAASVGATRSARSELAGEAPPVDV